MKWIMTIGEMRPDDGARVGGKAMALARLAREGLAVPHTLCVPAGVYRYFLAASGLEERVLTELNRKPFKEMRWEEIWDCALRVRNMFLTTALPADVTDALTGAVAGAFGNKPVAVRSSAPGEDGAKASFAGLHESYLNVRGPAEILNHIRLVWASLWSDAALLYRQELGLDARKSTMSVVIQALEAGSRSGVFFGVNPNDHEQSVLEAVYGLNQGLVDGEIAPDRWIIERASGRIIDHTLPERQERLVPGTFGVVTEPLPFSLAQHPPLSPGEVARVVSAGRQAETLFGSPQDMEWTFTEKDLVILQSRPITSGDGTATGDKRAWYLSLHRSFENLKALEAKITGRLIPAMIEATGEMAATNLTGLSDAELAAEIEHRRGVNDHWVQVYWSDFIPFAHGMRLFGQFYNDTIQPEDPYEFMRLLEKSDLVSVKRNRMLAEMAQMVREDELLRKRLQDGEGPDTGHDFEHLLTSFIEQFGDLTCPVTGGTQCRQGSDPVIRIVVELSGGTNRPLGDTVGEDTPRLQEHFLSCFEGERRKYALAMLELGRNSYKLRDDDNIYLGRIESQFYAALREARSRLAVADERRLPETHRQQLETALGGFEVEATMVQSIGKKATPDSQLKARQIVGQPAGPGLASGTARVIRQHDDLLDFKRDEILICDSVDPNMTFIVPLAAAVVERRGGMLIHGAIIAREYGIPCVTGVPDAMDLIHTGDYVTVDGFLGVVTLGTAEL
jgi:rifampicin phosphotransferase